ncbi:hypothetical protein CKA32_002824 [Geitlerinema sp. FC II]|nr:hypothetical protein CKA32_002824 [Geitlerinema sp. FC II]
MAMGSDFCESFLNLPKVPCSLRVRWVTIFLAIRKSHLR